MKKLIIIALLAALISPLTGCHKESPMPEGFKLPTAPPSPETMQPPYGPND